MLRAAWRVCVLTCGNSTALGRRPQHKGKHVIFGRQKMSVLDSTEPLKNKIKK